MYRPCKIVFKTLLGRENGDDSLGERQGHCSIDPEINGSSITSHLASTWSEEIHLLSIIPGVGIVS